MEFELVLKVDGGQIVQSVEREGKLSCKCIWFDIEKQIGEFASFSKATARCASVLYWQNGAFHFIGTYEQYIRTAPYKLSLNRINKWYLETYKNDEYFKVLENFWKRPINRIIVVGRKFDLKK